MSIVDDAEKVMEVIVEDKQLSLAIGKKGQNVRLAAKLTGWKIDIKSEEEKRREVEAQFGALEIGERDEASGGGRRSGRADRRAEAADQRRGAAAEATGDRGGGGRADDRRRRRRGSSAEASAGRPKTPAEQTRSRPRTRNRNTSSRTIN